MEKKNIDWSNIGFGYIPTDKRFVSNYKNGAWDEGTLTSDATVTISECAGVLQYAQTCFDMSGSSWCCTVEIADTDRDRLYAALEVRAYRSNKYTELVLIRRLYTDDCVASEHVRTDVERSA